jgi:hypothetical protein
MQDRLCDARIKNYKFNVKHPFMFYKIWKLVQIGIKSLSGTCDIKVTDRLRKFFILSIFRIFLVGDVSG